VTRQPQISKDATEIKELSQTVRRNGVLVVARCYSVPGGQGPRYELFLEGDGQRGVVDIPGPEQGHLAHRIAEAVDAFTAAILLRLGRSAD